MWDARYGEEGWAYGTEPNDFLASVVTELPSGGRVLEVCAGEGRNAVFLAQQGHDVMAVDASGVGLAKAKGLAEARGVSLETEVVDLAAYAFVPSTWDGIVAIFAHLPQPLRTQVHQGIVEGLKPGGVLILEAYTPRQLQHKTGGPPVEAMLMEPAAIEQELAGLDFRILREVEREIVEGKYHRGTSAVLQILAHKPLAGGG